MFGDADFDRLVDLHYASLYRFALSLTRKQSDAGDLTQETFMVWAVKGGQVRDRSKAKAWLFTTLHRLFLRAHNRQRRFPAVELDETDLPAVEPVSANRMDGAGMMDLVARLEEPYRATVALFYLEDYSYQEIADVLGVPLGTVKSRLARGLGQLKEWVGAIDGGRRDWEGQRS